MLKSGINKLFILFLFICFSLTLGWVSTTYFFSNTIDDTDDNRLPQIFYANQVNHEIFRAMMESISYAYLVNNVGDKRAADLYLEEEEELSESIERMEASVEDYLASTSYPEETKREFSQQIAETIKSLREIVDANRGSGNLEKAFEIKERIEDAEEYFEEFFEAKLKDHRADFHEARTFADYITIISIVGSMFMFLAVVAILLYFRSRFNKLVEANLDYQAELKQIVDDKNSLIAIVCHDIANPLNAIVLSNNLVIGDDFKNRRIIEKTSDKIKRASEKIHNIIEMTRNMHHTSLSKNSIPLAAVSVQEVFDDVLLTFQDVAREKGVILEGAQAIGDIFVMAESTTLKSNVLSNLVSNAIKFTPAGKKVKISAARKNGAVEIRVSDEGVGIPKEQLKGLFTFGENFSRDGTDGEKGTGFGMPIVRLWVDHYGGKIKVLSRTEADQSNGTGTEFIIELKGEKGIERLKAA